ncbi:permease [Haloarchaeobius sp. HRN-SO-5]|uniref:permease n=1 Tax=Haloarchaeobius sp. HRN-SO-5 TaxID=3446118 RepID=UPI003EBA2A26
MTPEIAAVPLTLRADLLDSARYFAWLFATIVPLFVLASFLVGLVQEYASPGRVREALEQRDEGSGNLAAAGLGAVTPFCSCSSIPLVAGLLQARAPLGIVFSFLLASPLVNEIAVPLLVGLFGLRVAGLYVLVMYVAAVAGGLVIGRLLAFEEHVRVDGIASVSPDSPAMADGGTNGAVASPERPHREHGRAAAGHAWSFLREMLPYVTLGMVAAALIHAVVPVSWLQSLLGPSNPVAVPLAVLAGVPMYFSLSAMLPVAASLASKGIPIGTVLALLVGTVGVSLPNLVMLNKLFSRRLLVAYVSTVVTIGIGVGLAFNAVLV